MIVTMEHVEILDMCDKLATNILSSDVMNEYETAYINLKNDRHAQKLIRLFTNAKEKHEEVERFGRYHPDYSNIMQEVRMVKREMDLHETVAKFKIAERNLQRFLDDISEIIAKSVSDQIIVPKDDNLYAESGCSTGGCASGGACSCNVS